MPQPKQALALSAPQIVQVLRVSSFLPLARAMRFSYSNFFSRHDMTWCASLRPGVRRSLSVRQRGKIAQNLTPSREPPPLRAARASRRGVSLVGGAEEVPNADTRIRTNRDELALVRACVEINHWFGWS